jgi:glycosyltransferase involved in cell wall biosynthesis
MPAHNHERFVGAAINSLLEQTFQDWELIVIDDGSRDRTLSVIRSYQDRRLRVYSQANRGLSATLNRGLELAAGEFWGFLPSDDMLLPEKLARQVTLLDAEPDVAVVFAFQQVIDAEGRPLGDHPILEWTRVPWRTREEMLPALFERNFLSAPSALARTEALRRAGGFDESLRYAQDYDMWLRLLRIGDARLLPEVLVAYRWHGGNETYVTTEATMYERAVVLLKAYATLRLEDVFPALRGRDEPVARAQARLAWARWIARSGLVELLPAAQLEVNEARRLAPGCVVDPELADLLARRPAFVDLRDLRAKERERELEALGRHLRAEAARLEGVRGQLECWEADVSRREAEVARLRALWVTRTALWVLRRARSVWRRLPPGAREALAPILGRRRGAATAPGERTASVAAAPLPAAAAETPGPVDWRFRPMPLVSVVLPVYNQAAYLSDAIESVLAQTYPNVELIVVDDGSTDGVDRILARYVEHPRVRVLAMPEHRGLPRALTAGFREARGALLTWTSADNIALPQQLERLVDFLLREPAVDMVFSNVEVIDEAGNLLVGSTYRTHNQSPPGGSLIALPHTVETLGEDEDNFINASFLYRAELGEIFGAYDWTLLGTEDYDYWLRIAAHFTIRHIDTEAPLYRYRVHGNTLSERHGAREIWANVRALVARHRERAAFYREPLVLWVVTRDAPAWERRGRYERLTEAWLRLGMPVVWLSAEAASGAGTRPGLTHRVLDGPRTWDGLDAYVGAPKRVVLWGTGALAPEALPALWHEAGAYCVLDAPLPASRWGGRVDAVSTWAVEQGVLVPEGVSRCPLTTGLEVEPLLRRARDNRYRLPELSADAHTLYVCPLPEDAGDLDVDALAAAARRRPEAQFGLVPRHAASPGWAGSLDVPRNVRLLAPRAERELHVVLSACRAVFVPLRGSSPTATWLALEAVALALAAGRPVIVPAELAPVDAPGCYVYRGAREVADVLDHARAHPPSGAACDGYLRRRSWAAQARYLAATANNGLFLRRTRPPDPAAARPVPFATRLGPRRTVLVEVRSLDRGGLEEVVHGLVVHLDHRRYRPVVVCVERADGWVATRCRRAGIAVHGLGDDRRSAYEALLDRYAPDVLTTHYSCFGLPAAAARGIPVVDVVHNVYVWWDSADVQACRARDPMIRRYVAVSDTVGRYAQEVLGLPPDKLVIIPNGLDVPRHRALRRRSASVTRPALGLSGRDYVFLHVAAVDGRKGHNALIAALARLVPRHPHVRVLSVGPVMDAAYQGEMESRIRRQGLEAHFRFLGFREDVVDLYRLADAFVLPSLFEGMSVALLEALYHGLPVIATRVGAAEALLGDGACGRLVPPPYADLRALDFASLMRTGREEAPSNVGELEAAMEDFLEHPGRWRDQGAAGTARVEGAYDLTTTVRRYEGLFETVAAEARARRPPVGPAGDAR